MHCLRFKAPFNIDLSSEGKIGAKKKDSSSSVNISTDSTSNISSTSSVTSNSSKKEGASMCPTLHLIDLESERW